MAPSLSESSVEPSSMILSASPGAVGDNLGPSLKILHELVVRDDVNGLQIRDGREIIEHPFDHRFARHFEERFRLCRVRG